MVSKISDLKKDEFNEKEEKLLKSGSDYPTVELLDCKEGYYLFLHAHGVWSDGLEHETGKNKIVGLLAAWQEKEF